jgi:hypothetical protein
MDFDVACRAVSVLCGEIVAWSSRFLRTYTMILAVAFQAEL